MQFHFPISPRPVISDYDHHLPLVVMQLEPTAPTSSGNTNKCTCWWIYCYANQCKRLNLSEHARKQMQTVWIKTPTSVFFSCWCKFCYIWKCIYSMSRVIFIPPCTPQLSPVFLTGTEKPCVKAVTITRAHVCIDRRATDLFMHFWIFINLQTAKESINKNTCGIAFHRLPTRHDMYRPAVHIASQACPCTFTRLDTCGVMQTCNSSWRRK